MTTSFLAAYLTDFFSKIVVSRNSSMQPACMVTLPVDCNWVGVCWLPIEALALGLMLPQLTVPVNCPLVDTVPLTLGGAVTNWMLPPPPVPDPVSTVPTTSSAAPLSSPETMVTLPFAPDPVPPDDMLPLKVTLPLWAIIVISPPFPPASVLPVVTV